MNAAQTTLDEFPRNITAAPLNGAPVRLQPVLVEEPAETTGSSNPPTPRRPWRKYALFATLAVLAIAGAVAGGRYWWMTARFIETTDDAYVGGNITVMSPKVPGLIANLMVEDNQSVRAGDLLLKLDDRDYAAALAKAEAAVAVQHATLTNLAATHYQQEAVVAQANAAIKAADAEITRTRDEQLRFERLLQETAVSVQDARRADAAYAEALAVGEKAHAGLSAAQRQLTVIETQVQQTQAALHESLAGRDLARLNLGYTELRAPIDATIGNRSAQVGSYAGTGAQLLSLVPAHGLWVDANFKESQLARIRPGAPATIEVDSIPGRVLRGQVVSVAPATGARFSILPSENATGNFTKIVQRVAVRIVLDDESAVAGQLRPGLSVIAKVNTAASHATERAGL